MEYQLLNPMRQTVLEMVMPPHNWFGQSITSFPLRANIIPSAHFHFNKDGYSIYCREFKEYQEWLKKRNELRFQETFASWPTI